MTTKTKTSAKKATKTAKPMATKTTPKAKTMKTAVKAKATDAKKLSQFDPPIGEPVESETRPR